MKIIITSIVIIIVILIVGLIIVHRNRNNLVEALEIGEIWVEISYNPEDPIFFSHRYDKDLLEIGEIKETVIPETPDPDKHRLVGYFINLKNIGNKTLHYIMVEVVLDPLFKNKIIHGTYCSFAPYKLGPDQEAYDRIFFLTEGDPEEINKLAYLNRIRIIWEERGKRYEKIVPVKPVE